MTTAPEFDYIPASHPRYANTERPVLVGDLATHPDVNSDEPGRVFRVGALNVHLTFPDRPNAEVSSWHLTYVADRGHDPCVQILDRLADIADELADIRKSLETDQL